MLRQSKDIHEKNEFSRVERLMFKYLNNVYEISVI